jgi:thiol-disulfide isomerase/thioredoxin
MLKLARRAGRFLLFVALAAAVIVVARGRAPSSSEASFAGSPELVAATFSSAWCSACMILKPRLAKAIPAFAGKPVKFVEYDFTFGDRAETRSAAAADGLGAVYDKFARSTGFTLLIDADTGEIIDILTINHSAKAMKAAIGGALAKAALSGQDDPYKDG